MENLETPIDTYIEKEIKKNIIENDPTTEQIEISKRFLHETSVVTHDMIGNLEKIIKDTPVYGPIDSRRLGKSLGLNLVDGGFMCNFECTYCEYKQEDFEKIQAGGKNKITLRDDEEIVSTLKDWLQNNPEEPIDSITFAGNTEPLLNKDFPEMLQKVVELRDEYRPDTKISLFTNSYKAGEVDLSEIDNAFLKLDAGNQKTFEKLNKARGVTFDEIVKQISNSNAKQMDIETMIVGGEDGNLNEENINDYINVILKINPDKVGLYSILYATPDKGDIKPASDDDLIEIANKITLAFEKEDKKILVEVFKNGNIIGKPRTY